MAALLRRLFRIQPNEGLLTIALAVLMLSNSIAQQIAGVVGYSGLVNDSGPFAVLVSWIVDYTLVAIVGGIVMLYVDRINRVRALEWMSVGFAFAFIIIRLMFAISAIPSWLPYALMYLISDQQFLVFTAVFWVLANDTVGMSQAKRIFPVVASMGFVGKLLGYAISGLSPAVLAHFNAQSFEVLNFIPLLYVLTFLVTRWRFGTLRVFKEARTQQAQSLVTEVKEAWNFVKGVPSFKYLAISMGVLSAASVVLEFYYTVFAKGQFANPAAFQAFHSAYRLTLALLSFGAQTFLTSRILAKMKLEKVFLIVPIMTVIGLIGAFAVPGLVTACIALVAYKLPRNTVDESAQKSLRSLVPDERRGRVSLLFDTAIIGFSSAAVCVVTCGIVIVGPLLMGQNYFYLYLLEGLILAVIGLWTAWRARQTYEASLLSWQLSRRRKGGKMLDKLFD